MRNLLSITVLLAACTPRSEPVSQDADTDPDTSLPDAAVDAVPIDGATAFPSACAIPLNASHAWTLDIAVASAFKIQSDVLYEVDRRSQLLSTSFTRVAYCLQLDATFMYAEFDDFTSGQIVDVGIPTESIFEKSLTNMTVRTNASGISDATNVSGGAIEMWPNCYGSGLNSTYDYDDAVGAASDCYGSFQVHLGTTTLFAYNQWSSSGDDDLGIGNQPLNNPDWTFAGNAAAYSVRKLQAFVIP
jgi:hypothetical protein